FFAKTFLEPKTYETASQKIDNLKEIQSYDCLRIHAIREMLIKKITLSTNSVSKEFKTLYKKTCEYFDNFRHIFNKNIAAFAKDFLVKNRDPTDENLEHFVAEKVCHQKLSKYLDASDFSEFKKSSSIKSLESFVAESLKIHVEYQIAVHNKEKPSYSEDVLAKIKKLDQLTIHITIPSASRCNYINELDLNQISGELSSDNK
ncbi:24743_t:CDS:2, partial [Racocetra persica]